MIKRKSYRFITRRIRVMIIACKNTNRKKNKGSTATDLNRSDLDSGCESCYFFETHRGDSMYDDWAKCFAPKPIKYNDEIEVIEERVKKITPKQDTPNGDK